MGYQISVDGEDNRGLAVWLVAMKGLAATVETHDGQQFQGQIDHLRTDEPQTIYLLPVDLLGRPVDHVPVSRVEVDQIAEVSIW